MRAYIKEALMGLLANESKDVMTAASTCVAAIAVIEIPLGQWGDLL
jgi:hypothetical protein